MGVGPGDISILAVTLVEFNLVGNCDDLYNKNVLVKRLASNVVSVSSSRHRIPAHHRDVTPHSGGQDVAPSAHPGEPSEEGGGNLILGGDRDHEAER